MHNLLFYNNGSEPTSSVILPYSITKSFCGLAVVHISQFKLNDGRIPPSFNLSCSSNSKGCKAPSVAFVFPFNLKRSRNWFDFKRFENFLLSFFFFAFQKKILDALKKSNNICSFKD